MANGSRRRTSNPPGPAASGAPGRRGRPAEQQAPHGASSILVRIGEMGALVLVLTPIILALLGLALVLVVLGFSWLGG